MSKSWIWATRIGELASKTGQLVWAADSRRFAFNSRKGGKYYGCDLYELAEARWKKLPGLEHNNGVGQIVERALRKAVKRLGAKQDEMNTVMTQWRVRRWIDNDTFEAYVGDARRVASKKDPDDWDYFGCALLFRGKCDNRAGWKAASIRQLSDAEDEKIKKEDE